MFENKKIFVLGMGRSGISVARLLADKNEVVITDIKNDNENDVEDLEKIGVKVIITEDQASIFDNSFDAVIKNPVHIMFNIFSSFFYCISIKLLIFI